MNGTNNFMSRILKNIEQSAEDASALNDNDYIQDGILYCGECNTPKQCEVFLLGEQKKVPCLCECAKARYDAERDEDKRKQRMYRIEQMRRSGFPDADLENCTFEKDDGKNEKISKVAKNYVEHFSDMLAKGKGLLFYGSVGTGKTFYSACIVNELINKGYPSMITNFARLVNTISGMFEGKQDYIDSLNRFDLLVIDDLASERDTEYMNEIVQNIIDSRYRAGLPTIITTNLSAQEIKNPADIRKQRTYSRLLEMCVPIEVVGADRRREKLKDDYAEMKDLLGL